MPVVEGNNQYIPMNRRTFLQSSFALAGWATSHENWDLESDLTGNILSVKGVIRPEQMGSTLCHEHILVDFIGAAEVSPNRYVRQQVFDKALPYLRRIRELGCQTFIDCTPAY